MLIDRPARSLDRAFSYSVPGHLAERLAVGSYVLVPFGRQELPGFVVGFTDQAPPARVKPVYGLLLDQPLFDERMVDLATWLAERYVAPLADALRLLLPPGSARKPRRSVHLLPAGGEGAALDRLRRAPRQQAVLAGLQRGPDAPEFEQLFRSLRAADASLTPAALDSALSALAARGYLELRRELQRPAVRVVERQVVRLLETEMPGEELVAKLAARAPRQAEVIATLLATEDCVAAASEFNRGAVSALVKKGYVALETEAREREPEIVAWAGASIDFLRLNSAQRLVYDHLAAALDAHRHEQVLLHGVTGSGKTEVYLHCVDRVLRAGRSAIVLVPEIALTPQMVGRFRARFGRQLALMHSGLSQGERFDEWRRCHRGEARIVVGARSAVFAPVPDLGIVIVDEEHENAYKQEQPPRYHAVEVARRRAQLTRAVLLLGSATPSLEHYYEARRPASPLQLVELPERVDDRPMPGVTIIDLRGETLVGKGETFSQALLDSVSDRLGAGEQVMLFLNRRGFSTFIMCRQCGHVLRCPDCEISLTFHHHYHTLRCHHCDYAQHVPEQCPNCQGYDLGFHGLGTERVADQVQRVFPEAKVARMDRDTIGHKGAYGRILRAFAAGQANVLVGTQMIAKGHDFPGVTLVGVLNADTGLHRSHFRAAEDTFQLLTQVSGRAGRADKPGEVLVQTYNPDHYAITTASRHDYPAFYQRELIFREKDCYPPFARLARLVFAASEQALAAAEAGRFAALLKDMGICEKAGDVHYLGPAEAPLKKLRGKYRYSILIKARNDSISERLKEALGRFQSSGNATITVDVDPTDMM